MTHSLFFLLLTFISLTPLTRATSQRIHFFHTNGVLMDGGFNQMAKETLDGAVANQIIAEYSAYKVDEVSAMSSVDSIIEGGADPISDLIIFLGFELDDVAAEVAPKYPQFYFVQIDSCYYSDPTRGVPTAENVVCVLFQEDQIAFAAGYAAATVSKTGVVGGIFGAPLDPLLRFENGFKSGARHANQSVVVETQYIHSFEEPEKGAEVAEFMAIEKNADVIFGAAGGTSVGTLDWCLSHQVLAIGVDSDQFYSVYKGGTDNTTDPSIDLSNLLTSAEKGIDIAIDRMVKEFVQGILPESAAKFQYIFDYENNGIRLSDWHLSTDHITLDEIQEVRNVEKQLAVKLIKSGVVNNKLDPFGESAPYSYTTMKPFAAPPSARFNSASAMIKDPYHDSEVLVVFGGTDKNGNQLSDLWELNVLGNTWEQRTTNNLLNDAGFLLKGGGFAIPSARASAAMAELTGVASYGCCGDSGQVFMWGGFDGEYKNDGWVLTRDMSWFPAASQWTELPDLAKDVTQPSARHSHSMASVGSSTYMFGGKDADGTVADFWVHEFPTDALAGNETSHTWTALETPTTMLQEGLVGSMMIANTEFVYLFGGETQSGVKVGTLHKYDVTAKKWTEHAAAPEGISFGLMAFMGDETIYVSDGSTGKIWIYVISDGAWHEMKCTNEEEKETDAGMFVTNSAGGSTSAGQFLQFGGIQESGEIVNTLTVLVTGNMVCDEFVVLSAKGASKGSEQMWIAIILASIVFMIFFYLYFRIRREEDLDRIKKLFSEVNRVEKENEELHENLMILRKYTKGECEMIDDAIACFRDDFRKMASKRDGSLIDEAEANKALEKLLISARELESEEVVGKGSFGSVHKSKYRGAYVAVKTLHEVDRESLRRFQAEILLMADLVHTNIVRLVGACWEKDLMALVMEFAEKGMSSEVAREEGDHFSWDDPLLKWCKDTARALRYLHGVNYSDLKTGDEVSGIIHRDLKPDNCLVTETYTIKVADFGEARAFNENNTMTQVGTPLFIAPEIVKGDHYSTKADVFSYGLTVLSWALKGSNSLMDFFHCNLMYGSANAIGMEGAPDTTSLRPSLGKITHAIINKGWRPSKKAIKEYDVPSAVIDLLNLCWLDNPKERPPFTEIVEYLENEATIEVSTQRLEAADNLPSRLINRHVSVSGALKARILAREMEGKGTEMEKKARVESKLRNLVELLDANGSEIQEEELSFARKVIESVVKGRWGRGGGTEGYLEGMKGEDLQKRLEEDHKMEEEILAILQRRKEKREMHNGGVPGIT